MEAVRRPGGTLVASPAGGELARLPGAEVVDHDVEGAALDPGGVGQFAPLARGGPRRGVVVGTLEGDPAQVQPVPVHGVDLRGPGAVGGERQGAPVRRPGGGDVDGLVIGEAAEFAAVHRRQVDLGLSVPVRGEGDPLPVGRPGRRERLVVADQLLAAALVEERQVERRRPLPVGDVTEGASVGGPGGRDVQRAVRGDRTLAEAVVVHQVDLFAPLLPPGGGERDPGARDAQVAAGLQQQVVRDAVGEGARGVGSGGVSAGEDALPGAHRVEPDFDDQPALLDPRVPADEDVGADRFPLVVVEDSLRGALLGDPVEALRQQPVHPGVGDVVPEHFAERRRRVLRSRFPVRLFRGGRLRDRRLRGRRLRGRGGDGEVGDGDPHRTAGPADVQVPVAALRRRRGGGARRKRPERRRQVGAQAREEGRGEEPQQRRSEGKSPHRSPPAAAVGPPGAGQ